MMGLIIRGGEFVDRLQLHREAQQQGKLPFLAWRYAKEHGLDIKAQEAAMAEADQRESKDLEAYAAYVRQASSKIAVGKVITPQ